MDKAHCSLTSILQSIKMNKILLHAHLLQNKWKKTMKLIFVSLLFQSKSLKKNSDLSWAKQEKFFLLNLEIKTNKIRWEKLLSITKLDMFATLMSNKLKDVFNYMTLLVHLDLERNNSWLISGNLDMTFKLRRKRRTWTKWSNKSIWSSKFIKFS